MSFLLANITKSWAWALPRFVSGNIAIEVYLIRAYISKMTGAIAFTAGRNLAAVLDKDFKFTGAKKTWDGLAHTHTIMT